MLLGKDLRKRIRNGEKKRDFYFEFRSFLTRKTSNMVIMLRY
jgi:hypothetical protein